MIFRSANGKCAFLLHDPSSNFPNIVDMVRARVNDIPKYERLLLWHHSYQHVLRFLAMEMV